MALAMFSTAIFRKPSAISCGDRRMPVARSTSAASAANFVRTASASSGRSPSGPNTAGNSAGSSLPTMTLQSVTVSGPPRRYAAGPGLAPADWGPTRKLRAVEAADRAAARGHGVDAHHRRAQPDARDLGDERALVLAGVVGDVGRRAAHVEADDAVEAGEPRHLDRADDAAGRARQDRVLALEPVRVGEAARALHELQPRRQRRGRRADGSAAVGAAVGAADGAATTGAAPPARSRSTSST